MKSAAIIVTGLLGFSSAQAGSLKLEDARPMLKALGETIVDFQVCEGDWEAIYDAAHKLTENCAISTKERFRMNDYMSAMGDARELDIKDQGSSCKGSLSDRRDLVLEAVRKATAECKD